VEEHAREIPRNVQTLGPDLPDRRRVVDMREVVES
jgi:hypothetical protein